MDPVFEKAHDSIFELTKQIMTLSTGVLALTITFLKDAPGNSGRTGLWLLRLSWIGFVLSLLMGVVVMMALTGNLAPLSDDTGGGGQSVDGAFKGFEFGFNVRGPSFAQVFLFFASMLLVILHAIFRSSDPPTMQEGQRSEQSTDKDGT